MRFPHSNTFPSSRQQNLQRRRLVNSESSAVFTSDEDVSPLYQGQGTHYVDLWVGSPNPQRQTLIIDTGSSMTAFPCSDCTNCGQDYHVDVVYDEHLSDTFQEVECDQCSRRAKGHCHHSHKKKNSHESSRRNTKKKTNKKNKGNCFLDVRYTEGSRWEAFEARDVVILGGPQHDYSSNNGTLGYETSAAVPSMIRKQKTVQNTDPNGDHGHHRVSFTLMFGCQTLLTKLFLKQLADGIMGLDHSATSFWNQMHQDKPHLMPRRGFSLCYSRHNQISVNGTQAGALTMGGTDTRLHNQSPMVFAKFTRSNRGRYEVSVKNMYLCTHCWPWNGEKMPTTAKIEPLKGISVDDLNYHSVIVDSGTTNSFFTDRIAKAFAAAYKRASGGKAFPNKPMKMASKQELDALPTILIQLEGDEAINKQIAQHLNTTNLRLAGSLDRKHPYDVIVAVPPSHYMEYYSRDKVYLAGVSTNDPHGSTLGGNIFMGHDVYFDIDNNRIGWAESDCDYKTLGPLVSTINHPDSQTANATSKTPAETAKELKTAGRTNVTTSKKVTEKHTKKHPSTESNKKVPGNTTKQNALPPTTSHKKTPPHNTTKHTMKNQEKSTKQNASATTTNKHVVVETTRKKKKPSNSTKEHTPKHVGNKGHLNSTKNHSGQSKQTATNETIVHLPGHEQVPGKTTKKNMPTESKKVIPNKNATSENSTWSGIENKGKTPKKNETPHSMPRNNPTSHTQGNSTMMNETTTVPPDPNEKIPQPTQIKLDNEPDHVSSTGKISMNEDEDVCTGMFCGRGIMIGVVGLMFVFASLVILIRRGFETRHKVVDTDEYTDL